MGSSDEPMDAPGKGYSRAGPQSWFVTCSWQARDGEQETEEESAEEEAAEVNGEYFRNLMEKTNKRSEGRSGWRVGRTLIEAHLRSVLGSTGWQVLEFLRDHQLDGLHDRGRRLRHLSDFPVGESSYRR